MNFLVSRNFFLMNYDLKNGCKNESKDNDEESCRWSRKRVLTKSIPKPNGRATAMPTAWELRKNKFNWRVSSDSQGNSSSWQRDSWYLIFMNINSQAPDQKINPQAPDRTYTSITVKKPSQTFEIATNVFAGAENHVLTHIRNLSQE